MTNLSASLGINQLGSLCSIAGIIPKNANIAYQIMWLGGS